MARSALFAAPQQPSSAEDLRAPIEPGAGGAFGGELDDEAIEVAGLVGGEFVFVLEQGPAQTFERRIGSLLGTPHLVYGLARMSDHLEAFDEGDMSMQA